MSPGNSPALSCLAGGTVVTFDAGGTVFDPGEVWFRGGTIVAAGAPGAWKPADGEPAEIVDVRGRIVIPGFVNAHSHSYSAILKGTVEKGPLDIYMLDVIAAGNAMTPRECHVSAQLDALNMLRRGVTSVIDHYSERPALTAEGLDGACGGFEEIGIRATVAPMFSDRPYIETVPLGEDTLPAELRRWYAEQPRPDLARYFAIMEEALADRGAPAERVHVMLGVDGVQRCSERLIEMTGEFQQKHGAGLQTHMLEVKTQAAMRPPGGPGFVRLLADHGIINDRTSLVHFIWTDDEDIAAAREAGVTVVHCPQSNAMLGAGICPIIRLADEGIPVAFGTDGSNCGPASYIENLRIGAYLARLAEPDFEKWPDAAGLFHGAGSAGARAMGRPDELGVIAVGACADLAVLNPSGHWHEPMGEIHRHLFYYESGESVESVWVDGRQVVADGKLETVDEEALVSEAAEIAARRKSAMPEETRERIAAQYPAFRAMILEQFESEADIERRIRLA